MLSMVPTHDALKSGRSPAPNASPGSRVSLAFRAQAAIETLLMMGVVIAFIMPMLFLFFSASNERISNLEQIQAKALAQEVSDQAGEVWYLGNGSRRMLLVNFPQDLRNLSLSGDHVNDSQLLDYGREITVSLRVNPIGMRDLLINSPAPVRSRPPPTTGNCPQPANRLIPIEDRKLAVYTNSPIPTLRSGLVVLIFENNGTFVNIYRSTC